MRLEYYCSEPALKAVKMNVDMNYMTDVIIFYCIFNKTMCVQHAFCSKILFKLCKINLLNVYLCFISYTYSMFNVMLFSSCFLVSQVVGWCSE